MNKENRNLGLLLEYSEKAVIREEERRTTIDQKASMFMGFNSILLGVYYFSFQNFDKIPEQYHSIVTPVLLAASTFTLISLLFCLIVLIPKKYTIVPNPRKLYEKYKNSTHSVIVGELNKAFTEAFEENKQVGDNSSGSLFIATLYTFLGAASILVGFILLIIKLNG